jgi:hypothetical protein
VLPTTKVEGADHVVRADLAEQIARIIENPESADRADQDFRAVLT